MFAESSDDREMREMAREEMKGAEARLVELHDRLMRLLWYGLDRYPVEHGWGMAACHMVRHGRHGARGQWYPTLLVRSPVTVVQVWPIFFRPSARRNELVLLATARADLLVARRVAALLRDRPRRGLLHEREVPVAQRRSKVATARRRFPPPVPRHPATACTPSAAESLLPWCTDRPIACLHAFFYYGGFLAVLLLKAAGRYPRLPYATQGSNPRVASP